MADIIERLESILVVGTPKPMIIGMVIDEIKSLRQQLDECTREHTELFDGNYILVQQLAECQAREKVLRDKMDRARNILTNGNPTPECNWGMLDTETMTSNSTALDEAIKQAKREALLEAADTFEILGGPRTSQLRRMAEELK